MITSAIRHSFRKTPTGDTVLHTMSPTGRSAEPRRKRAQCGCGLCRRSLEHDQQVNRADRGLLTGRSLILVDHQNLCGGPSASDAVVGTLWDALVHTLAVKPNDDVVVALSGYAAAKYLTLLPLTRVRLLIGDGPHGAARVLTDFVDAAHVAARYDNVVIASGNHTFSDLARELRAHDVRLYNLTSSLSSASRDLADACGLRVRLKVRIETEPYRLASAA